VRRLCEDSKTAYQFNDGEYSELLKSVDVPGIEEVLRKEGVLGPGRTLKDLTWYRPGVAVDCPDGYRGRIAISEVLEVTEAIRQLIFRGANADEIRDAARAEGMRTIQEIGFLAAARGMTSVEEVLRAAKE
jgi:type IV pilus assembly protein PilB